MGLGFRHTITADEQQISNSEGNFKEVKNESVEKRSSDECKKLISKKNLHANRISLEYLFDETPNPYTTCNNQSSFRETGTVPDDTAYYKIIEDVKNDYAQRTNYDLVWCNLCNEINLWTYWQGRGNENAKILLVGQDWGCTFDSSFDKIKDKITQMNNGNTDIDYVENSNYPTDVHLIELFKILGYDLHKKSKDLFFTNLALGYRKNGSTGGLKKEWLTADVKYLCRLVCILKPKVILCLGKDTYEVTASALAGERIHIEKFYEALESNSNYTDIGDNMRIFGMAHCGSYGTMNRKKYATHLNESDDGMDLQKKDWLKIKDYLCNV